MRPYKDFVHKKRVNEKDENVITGIVVISLLGMLMGVMMGMAV